MKKKKSEQPRVKKNLESIIVQIFKEKREDENQKHRRKMEIFSYFANVLIKLGATAWLTFCHLVVQLTQPTDLVLPVFENSSATSPVPLSVSSPATPPREHR